MVGIGFVRRRSSIIQIDFFSIDFCVSSVLFHGRVGPSTEAAKAAEARVVVVISIPERVALTDGASAAHNAIPHVLTGVDTDRCAGANTSADEFGHVVTVGGDI